jgi:hypothetical protein
MALREVAHLGPLALGRAPIVAPRQVVREDLAFLKHAAPEVSRLAQEAQRRGMKPAQLADLLEDWFDERWYPPEDLHEAEEEVLVE